MLNAIGAVWVLTGSTRRIILPEVEDPGGEVLMGQGRPFLFCRYSMRIAEEVLRGAGQFELLQELQGLLVAHGKRAEIAGQRDTLIMRPRKVRIGRYDILTWSVGQQIDARVRALYDGKGDRLHFEEVADGSVRYNDFVAIPSLGVVAIDDRAGDLHLGGLQAIHRLQSAVSNKEDAGIDVVFFATPDEVRQALAKWELTKFKFTLRPNNPRPVGALGRELSELFKKEGIGQLTGAAKPAEGGQMQMRGNGFITAANQLTDAGYGQIAVSGVTEGGLEAEIKKPRFDPNPVKNERSQEKLRELRVFIEDDGVGEEDIFRTAAQALIKFYAENQ